MAIGWATVTSTKKWDVAKISAPMISALVAAAPTYPTTISRKLTGADSSS